MSQTRDELSNRTQRPKGRAHRAVRVVVMLVAGIAAIGMVLEAIALTTGRYLWTGGGMEPGLPVERLPTFQKAELQVDAPPGTLEDADLLLRLLNAAPLLLEAVTLLGAAWLLLGVLRRVAQREAFNSSVLRRWRALTATLLVGGVLIGLLSTLAVVYATSHMAMLGSGDGIPDFDAQAEFLGADYSGISIGLPHWPIAIIVAGLIALALTTAFRAGAQLERDVDGVI